MASEETGGRGEPVDPVETFDKAHGTSTRQDTERPSGLTEAGNKGPATPAGEPFKNLKSY